MYLPGDIALPLDSGTSTNYPYSVIFCGIPEYNLSDWEDPEINHRIQRMEPELSTSTKLKSLNKTYHRTRGLRVVLPLLNQLCVMASSRGKM